jgi:toxin ParE1/3/4
MTALLIMRRSPNGTKTIIQKIFDKIDLLITFPEIGRVVPELEYKDVREIIIAQYRIIYFNISSDRIDILKIHHSYLYLDVKDI